MGLFKTVVKCAIRHAVVGVLTAGHGNVLLLMQDANDCADAADAAASYGDYYDAQAYYQDSQDYYDAAVGNEAYKKGVSAGYDVPPKSGLLLIVVCREESYDQ
jgi:hypothetical protein